METVNESKESKASSVLNPLNQFLNLKSPVSNDKKSLKNIGIGSSSTTKRRKLQDKENIDAKKKKSKKMLQITNQ